MYYLLLVCATVLFSFQFLFNQKFEERNGSSLPSALLFSLYTSVLGFVVLFVTNGLSMDFSPLSFFLAGIYSAVGILYTVASIKAFNQVNLSVYSVFAMLGGMLLPSVYGLVFCDEAVTPMKLVCYVLIIAALFFETDFRQKSGNKLYYAAVFILNGMSGVLSVVHQSIQNYAIVDSFDFLMWAKIWGTVISLIFLVKMRNRVVWVTDVKSLATCFGFAVFCTVGNLLLLLSIRHLPASIQYPIVTGGVMLVSLVIGFVRKETVRRREFIATAIAFLSTCFIALQN